MNFLVRLRQKLRLRSRFRQYLNEPFRGEKLRKKWRHKTREFPTYLYWPLVKNRFATKTRFVVVTSARSGSGLLFNLLNSHPQIDCERKNEDDSEILSYRALAPFVFVRARAALGPAPVYGFKIFLWQMQLQRGDVTAFLQHLHDDGWKIIYLERRNTLRQAVSVEIAKNRWIWHEKKTDKRREKARVEPKSVLKTAQFFKTNIDKTRLLVEPLPHLTLFYEDDLLDETQRDQTMQRVFEYLNVPPHPPQTSLRRSSVDDWHDYIENADELIDAVRGTKFEPFLTQP